MSALISLWSRKTGEIKKFLESYYQKEIEMDDDVERWIYVYNKPLDVVDMISTVMDNNDKYDIAVCLQIDKGDIHPVTVENLNDIIKGIFCLYYEEPKELTY
ncbi:MAG: hypothetical protein QHH06_04130 [Clostridiales bacterium]|jgi:hypothetical protein|nr:hypothetical protein [Eubacteriales bacterium]MDH7565655.1 hypothetical protein [Clostridiales bacterium]